MKPTSLLLAATVLMSTPITSALAASATPPDVAKKPHVVKVVNFTMLMVNVLWNVTQKIKWNLHHVMSSAVLLHKKSSKEEV